MAEFTRCQHTETQGVADLPTAALDAWQKLGWEPIGESLTPEQALEAEVAGEQESAALATEVPDLTVTQILDEVGDDPEKAQAALEAEQARDKPRKTLVDRLTQKAGQPGDPEGN